MGAENSPLKFCFHSRFFFSAIISRVHHFEYHNGHLYCEEVPLRRIADEVGTPAYVYSERTLKRHVRVFEEAFADISHLTCYAVKANSNINILRRFAGWGTGFEIVSGGELFRVLKATGSAQKVIFDGAAPVNQDQQTACGLISRF